MTAAAGVKTRRRSKALVQPGPDPSLATQNDDQEIADDRGWKDEWQQNKSVDQTAEGVAVFRLDPSQGNSHRRHQQQGDGCHSQGERDGEGVGGAHGLVGGSKPKERKISCPSAEVK